MWAERRCFLTVAVRAHVHVRRTPLLFSGSRKSACACVQNAGAVFACPSDKLEVMGSGRRSHPKGTPDALSAYRWLLQNATWLYQDPKARRPGCQVAE
jgi:hypothetical protein